MKRYNILYLILIVSLSVLYSGCAHKLKITTIPKGASVFKGEKFKDAKLDIDKLPDSYFSLLGNSPLSVGAKKTKFYTTLFQARLKGYENSRIYTLADATKINNHNKLEIALGPKIIPKGELNFKFNVDNCDLFLNGEFIKKISGKEYNTQLNIGHYKINAKKDGYYPASSEIDLMSEKVISANFKMRKIEYGYVKLTSNEKDVDIYIDGKLMGQIKDKLPFNKKVPAGECFIMAKKEYFLPANIKANIEKHGVFPYHFRLKRFKGYFEQAPGRTEIIEASGDLTVGTERSDLIVYIEGEKKIPPFTLEGLPAGIYNMKITGPNIKKKLTVTVNVNERAFVDLDEKIKK